MDLTPTQQKTVCDNFVKQFNALAHSFENGAMAGIQLGRLCNTFFESKAYLAVCKTIDQFCTDHLNRKTQYVEKLRRLARFKDAQALIEATTGEVSTTPDKGWKAVFEEKKEENRKLEVSKIQKALANPVPRDGVVIDLPQTNKKPSSSKPKVQDDMGVIIPEPILPIWERRQELRQLMTEVSRIKCLMEERRKEEDPLFMKVDQSAIMRAEQLHHLLSNAMPSVVCGVCEGRLEILPGKACRSCNSTGLMSREQYDRLVPEEKQKIRARGIELRKAK